MITYHGVGTADFKNVLHTAAARSELLRLLAPVGNFLVVDHVVGAESLELVALSGGRSGGDDLCASGFGELHSEHADTASALGKDPVTRLQAAALQTVKAVPSGQTGACERAALQEVEVGGHADETLLVESAVLLKGAINGSTDTGGDTVVVERAGDVGLVEEGEDLVALLETGHARADFLDDTGAIRRGNHVLSLGERVEALNDGKIAVVERSTVDCGSLSAGEDS